MQNERVNGVLYVATKQNHYVEEAFLSACSIKERYPDLSITIFTDDVRHPVCSTPVFDCVKPISGNAGIRHPWAEGQLNRIRCLPDTPYDRTLHLDTDTRIVTNDLKSLFDVLSVVDLGMVETAVDDSYSRATLGRRMFNAGLVLYRRNAKVWEWLHRWAELSVRNFRLASRTTLPALTLLDHVSDDFTKRRLLCMDQISLVELISPEHNDCQLAIRILDYSWNYRGSRLSENNKLPVRILHNPRELSRTHQEDLDSALAKWRK